MKVVSVTQAKNGLSALIDLVQSGEMVLIVDRGRPVARLDTAVSAALADPEGRLTRLQRAGIVHIGSPPAARPPPARRPSLTPGASGVEALIKERRGGR